MMCCAYPANLGADTRNGLSGPAAHRGRARRRPSEGLAHGGEPGPLAWSPGRRTAAAWQDQADRSPSGASLAADVGLHGRATEREGMAARNAFSDPDRYPYGRGTRHALREVNWEAKVWVIPGQRMKAGRLHRVPLSPAALAVLAEVRPLMTSSGDLVFPSATGNKPLSDMALSMLVRGMAADGLAEGEPPRWRDAEGRAVVPHGFRSTFRDWAGETRNDGHDVVEAALAHTIKNKAEAAYARSDLLEKRRVLMDAWAQHCCRPPGEAVPLADRRGTGE